MTRLLLTVTYPRCPSCGAVDYPPWPIEHRPGCDHQHDDPTQWGQP